MFGRIKKNKDNSTIRDEIIAYILDCFDDLIAKYRLSVNVRKQTETITGIDLENKSDAMYICYSTHPSDYPFRFDVRYCKQKYIDKDFALYRHDTMEIVSLWRFDKHLNTTITGSLEKDIPIIYECCKKASEMFIYFQGISDDEYYSVAVKLKAPNKHGARGCRYSLLRQLL